MDSDFLKLGNAYLNLYVYIDVECLKIGVFVASPLSLDRTGCVFEIDRNDTEILDILTITSKDDTSELRHTLGGGFIFLPFKLEMMQLEEIFQNALGKNHQLCVQTSEIPLISQLEVLKQRIQWGRRLR